MSDKFVMTARQSAELDFALERNGWKPENVKALSSGDMLARFLPVLLGHAEIRMIEHVIDCDAPVFIPEKWEVLPDVEQLPNRILGQVKFDPKKVDLYLSLDQKNGKLIEGNKLRKGLVSTSVYTAHVLDYLLANPYLIPEEWKGKAVFFWGTIYRNAVGNLCVRYLFWRGNGWCWDYLWLDNDWVDDSPAAVSAS